MFSYPLHYAIMQPSNTLVMERPAAFLVDNSRLETTFLPGSVKHTRRLHHGLSSEQITMFEETWQIEQRSIGQGTFGVVRLETLAEIMTLSGRLDPIPPCTFRAVKEIKKRTTGRQVWDFRKELEATAFFSRQCVSRMSPFTTFFLVSYRTGPITDQRYLQL